MKKILAANFFPAFNPPMSGGEMKVLKFYSELSRHFHIDLVSFTYPTRSETVRHTEHFHEHRIAKPDSWNQLWTQMQAQDCTGELSQVISGLIGRHDNEFRLTMERFWDDADIVIYDFPLLYLQDPAPHDRSKLRVYNSHNLEAALSRAIISGHNEQVHNLFEEAERALCQTSDLILATTPLEAKGFSLLYEVPEAKIEIMPLGFSPEDLLTKRPFVSTQDDEQFCFFIGSQHPPNVQAAHEVSLLASKMPDVHFVIAGAVCDALEGCPNNVEVLGRVDTETKRALFSSASVFLNPMRDGAGMNVKVVEALGAGLPVVTTPLGARGFDLEAKDLCQADNITTMEAAVRNFLREDAEAGTTLKVDRQSRIEATFGWSALADKAAERLATLTTDSKAKDDLEHPINLFINDYPIGEGTAGGQKRMLDLIDNIPSPFTKVVLTLSDDTTIKLTQRASNLIEINLPKDAAQRAFEQQINQWNTMSIADVATAMYVSENTLFMRWFRRLAKRAVTITYEHCYMAPAVASLPLHQRPQIFYSSHNVEAELKHEMLMRYRHSHRQEVSTAVREIEKHAAEQADVVFAVTDEDATRLNELYKLRKPAIAIANGTRFDNSSTEKRRRLPQIDEILELVFIGSAHPPNVSAVEDFLQHVLPELKKVHCTVIGSVCEALDRQTMPDNVTLAGRVSEAEKATLFDAAHIAINPLTVGGGSSLKVGDYQAAGLPLVTTEEGIRGFKLMHEHQVLVADVGPEFANQINRLRSDLPLYKKISAGGTEFAHRELDWKQLGKRVANEYNSKRSIHKVESKKSVLVITYRYTEPTRGGAEEYLLRVMRHLHNSDSADIDLVTLDIADITNSHGMVCSSSGKASDTPVFAPFSRNVRYFSCDKRIGMDPVVLGAELHQNRMQEEAGMASQLLDLASHSLLLSGWHHPEFNEDGTARWTNDRACILVKRDHDRLRVTGMAPSRRQIRFLIDGELIETTDAEGGFSFTVPCRLKQNSIVTIEIPGANRVAEDPRNLGIYVTNVSLGNGDKWEELSLHETLVDRAAAHHVDRFLEEAYRVSQNRAEDINQKISLARGLTSKKALAHIRKVAQHYDHVLVQGMQFSFIQDVTSELERLKVPFSLLPHMHLDDMFYHTQPFYNSISQASNVICPESDLYNKFLKRFNKPVVNIPGGGIDGDEYEQSQTLVEQTLLHYKLEARPYFLVLGRKNPAKHYRKIMEAFAKSGLENSTDLILVGPDEDGMPINAAGVHYLGALPRADVIALLKGCLAVISMSESESFGIVLAEAWACGKPVIANRDCYVYRELVENGTDGFLVNDTDQLSEKMRLFQTDTDLRNRLGKAGQRKALQRYEWKTVAKSVFEALL